MQRFADIWMGIALNATYGQERGDDPLTAPSTETYATAGTPPLLQPG